MKSLFEEKGGTYRREGDYLIPNLEAPEPVPLGIWGQRRRRYLRVHRNGLYTGMLLSGSLDSHLAQIDVQAQEMLTSLVTQMANAEGVTEELKANDQMEWVRRMNSIRNRAEEIVHKELIHV